MVTFLAMGYTTHPTVCRKIIKSENFLVASMSAHFPICCRHLKASGSVKVMSLVFENCYSAVKTHTNFISLTFGRRMNKMCEILVVFNEHCSL